MESLKGLFFYHCEKEVKMKTRRIFLFSLCGILLYLIPLTVSAHHLGRGAGSAPDTVDDYAHGANAVQTGMTENAADNGNVNSMQGMASSMDGGPDNTSGTVNADQSMQGYVNNDGSIADGSHGAGASASAGDTGAGGGDGSDGSGSGGSDGSGSGGSDGSGSDGNGSGGSGGRN